MTRLRDDKDFRGAIENAAGILGLRPQYLEKDYWVTEVIRALNDEFPGHFVFKGGTSLSKGYGLIERFSEDVDILIHGNRAGRGWGPAGDGLCRRHGTGGDGLD